MHTCQADKFNNKDISIFSITQYSSPANNNYCTGTTRIAFNVSFFIQFYIVASMRIAKGGENAFRPKTLKPREATVCYYLIRVYGIIGHSCALRASSEMRNVVFDLKGK